MLIVGTGLTMADAVVSLQHNGHTGQITAISRRGIIPKALDPSKQYLLPKITVCKACRWIEYTRASLTLWGRTQVEYDDHSVSKNLFIMQVVAGLPSDWCRMLHLLRMTLSCISKGGRHSFEDSIEVQISSQCSTILRTSSEQPGNCTRLS